MSDEPETIMLTRSQGARLMAICALLKDGDINLRGHDDEEVESAREALIDAGEECALQFGGLGEV